jgi:hypothetical protein
MAVCSPRNVYPGDEHCKYVNNFLPHCDPRCRLMYIEIMHCSRPEQGYSYLAPDVSIINAFFKGVCQRKRKCSKKSTFLDNSRNIIILTLYIIHFLHVVPVVFVMNFYVAKPQEKKSHAERKAQRPKYFHVLHAEWGFGCSLRAQ